VSGVYTGLLQEPFGYGWTTTAFPRHQDDFKSRFFQKPGSGMTDFRAVVFQEGIVKQDDLSMPGRWSMAWPLRKPLAKCLLSKGWQ
jgi:hypothetical protein